MNPLGPAPDAVPVAPRQRIAFLDVLRGFALFGVLLVNIEYFFTPSYGYMRIAAGWDSFWDLAAMRIVRCLAESKFYTLFSFLFGYGLSLQAARLESAGISVGRFAVRRLGVLLIAGAIHGALLWPGDILLTYAVLGGIVLTVRRWPARRLLIAAGCGLAVPVLALAVMAAVLDPDLREAEAASELRAEIAEYAAAEETRAREALEIYPGDDVAKILVRRRSDWLQVLAMMLFISPNVLAIMLLGLAAARHGLGSPSAGVPAARRVIWPALGVGLAGSVLYTALSEGQASALPSWRLTAALAVNSVAAPALAAFYAAFLMLWMSRGRPLAPLAATGRMALTHYLLQSVICGTLAAGYGLGWFGRVRPPEWVGLAVAIFGLQVAASRWWLSHWTYGPAEWVWRRLTYGRSPGP